MTSRDEGPAASDHRARHHLAELNIAVLRAPLEAEENSEFVAVLDAVNRIAEVSTGFVWRLTSDDGAVVVDDDPRVIVNYSIWTDLESLRHFTYRSGHGSYFRRRRDWFESERSRVVCWWIPAGEIPGIDEALRRLELLEQLGPSPRAFTLSVTFTPDGERDPGGIT